MIWCALSDRLASIQTVDGSKSLSSHFCFDGIFVLCRVTPMFYGRAVQQLDHRPHQVVGETERDTIKDKRKGDDNRRQDGR